MERWTIEAILSSVCGGLNSELHKEGRHKKNKFHNIPIEIDGHVFQSKKEGRRYIALKTLQTLGEIKELQVHIPFKLSVCEYVCDFIYQDKTGRIIIEDVKSPVTRTAAYKLKRKLMLQELNISITET